jgi:ubiquinone/menaquinone biosynthesis C-methylase UbiE
LPADAFYLGLDISLGMLRRAQRRLAREQLSGHLVHADALSLPLMDEGFDFILCMGVLQHLAAPRKALNEMARVARSGARVLVLDEVSSARRLLKRLAIAPSENPPAALAGALRPPACRLEAPPKLLGDYYALTLRKLPTSAG